MTATIARKDPAPWTKIYWPTALIVAVLGFMAADIWAPQYRGQALAIGAALILIPELTVLIMGRDQDTFSDWTWGVVGVHPQPLDHWTAKHFLALILYLVIAVRVLTYVWQHQNIWLALASTGVAAWLVFHLFGGWWR